MLLVRSAWTGAEPMSTIVSPFPVYEGDVTVAPGASWWRFRLTPTNDDGNFLMVRTDATDDAAPTWVSWEFFDGENCVIDTGLDRPTKTRMEIRNENGWIDVLYEGPPTPSKGWVQLTKPGVHVHPDDLT